LTATVLYLNPGATEEVLSIVRQELPPGWRLVPAQTANLQSQLAECDFLLVPDQPVRDEHLTAAPRLRMIQHQGVGYERIDLAACRTRRIPLCLTPEGTTTGVAEHTILLILALYKQLVKAATGTRQGHWMQWELRGASFELSGKTLGLVGFGRIGREVARRALAFDARVAYFDPLFSDDDHPQIARHASLESLLSTSDIVSLHVPVTAQTRKLVDDQFFRSMKPNAILVNTARGALIDESALLGALERRQLAGAALDVLDREPPDPAHPLLPQDNVLVTPHIAAGTRDALQAKMRAAFANMQRRLRGEPLWHLVPELADMFQGTP
jgi:glyoxylate reductase